MEDLDNKYKCRLHGVRTPVPCFRVSTLIAYEFSAVTVTVMGNQTEQLFGCKLDHLRAKHLYITEQIIPPELSAAVGQVYIFEVKGNKYGEWTAVGVEPAKDDVTITQPPTATATASATIVLELTLQTPEKTNTQQKRTSTTIQETLFAATRKQEEKVKRFQLHHQPSKIKRSSIEGELQGLFLDASLNIFTLSMVNIFLDNSKDQFLVFVAV